MATAEKVMDEIDGSDMSETGRLKREEIRARAAVIQKRQDIRGQALCLVEERRQNGGNKYQKGFDRSMAESAELEKAYKHASNELIDALDRDLAFIRQYCPGAALEGTILAELTEARDKRIELIKG